MAFVYPVLNFWREPEAYSDRSVPGWLEVGSMAFFPKTYLVGGDIQDLRDMIPPNVRNSPHLFPTIERGLHKPKPGDPGKRVPEEDWSNLKIGTYKLKHHRKWRDKAPGDSRYAFIAKHYVKCFRPVDPRITSLLIHDAIKDSSTNLEGCIAPGMYKKIPGQGVKESAEAMEKVFELLGGYKKDSEVTLNVWTNFPDEMRVKETWHRTK